MYSSCIHFTCLLKSTYGIYLGHMIFQGQTSSCKLKPVYSNKYVNRILDLLIFTQTKHVVTFKLKTMN